MNILEYIPFRGDPHGQAVNLCQKNIFALIVKKQLVTKIAL